MFYFLRYFYISTSRMNNVSGDNFPTAKKKKPTHIIFNYLIAYDINVSVLYAKHKSIELNTNRS